MPRLTFHWTVPVHAPVERVFSYLRDPETIFRAEGAGDPHVELRDLKVTANGVGSTGRNVFPLPGIGRLGVTGKVVNEITEVVPNRRIVVKSSPSMGRLVKFDGTWTWTFEPENGATKLTVDYEEWANWPVYTLDKLTEKQQTRMFGKAIAAWIESGLRASDTAPG